MSDDPNRPGNRTGTRPDTKIVHGGRRNEWLQGMVNVPVSRTSTVLFEDIVSMEAAYPPRDPLGQWGVLPFAPSARAEADLTALPVRPRSPHARNPRGGNPGQTLMEEALCNEDREEQP